jgi:hypothetical protein
VTPTMTVTPTETVTPTPTSTPIAPGVPHTFGFQFGISPERSYSGVYDTYIEVERQTMNLGSDPYLIVSSDGNWRPLLRFELSRYIPTNAVVTDASLRVYSLFSRGYGDVDVGIHEMLRSWTEDGATWHDAASGSPWQVPGCMDPGDRADAPSAVISIAHGSSPSWQSWENPELVSLVQRWVSYPSTNHGLVLIGSAESGRKWWNLPSSQFGLSEADREKRPRLEVTFQLPMPTPTSTGTATRTATATPTKSATPTLTPTATRFRLYQIFVPIIRKG